MSLARLVSSRAGCHGCRTAIVRCFLSPTARTSLAPSRLPLRRTAPARCFASTPARSGDSNRQLPLPAEYRRYGREEPGISVDRLEEPGTQEELAFPEEKHIDAVPVPWYLQAQRERDRSRTWHPVPTRELIPDLPIHPPPLLPEILHYISISLGLDDLLLLDLRHLDPPPALGSKLIMIIGTARSEKHLHVGADAFCRWLRKNHGLKPQPGGLLGRQELKIKMRRKAKRMRLLANAGGQEPEGAIDDGIRTNWICCSVGRIPAHHHDVSGAKHEKFIGFRTDVAYVNLVVQMFTEEKRAEIDLESLWGGVVKTHERENKRADEKLQELEVDEEEGDKGEEDAEVMHTAARTGDTVDTPPPRATTSESSQQQATPFRTNPPTFMGQDRPSWVRPRPGKSDPFPSAFDSKLGRQQVRHIHTERQEPSLAPTPCPENRPESLEPEARPRKPKAKTRPNIREYAEGASKLERISTSSTPEWPWTEQLIPLQPFPTKEELYRMASYIRTPISSLISMIFQAHTLHTALRTSPDQFSAEQRISISRKLATLANILAYNRRIAILDSLFSQRTVLNMTGRQVTRFLDLYQRAGAQRLRMAAKSPGLSYPERVLADLEYHKFLQDNIKSKIEEHRGLIKGRARILKHCTERLEGVFEPVAKSEGEQITADVSTTEHENAPVSEEEERVLQEQAQAEVLEPEPDIVTLVEDQTEALQVVEEQEQPQDNWEGSSDDVALHASEPTETKVTQFALYPLQTTKISFIKPAAEIKRTFNRTFKSLEPYLSHWEKISGIKIHNLPKSWRIDPKETETGKRYKSPQQSARKKSPAIFLIRKVPLGRPEPLPVKKILLGPESLPITRVEYERLRKVPSDVPDERYGELKKIISERDRVET
ncbi:hypothetical protein BCR34DRAFT_574472 [Clohesyomyces aquaticus]|uniref:ATPase synthesis protein 25 n=1 Tax=Clohesyomyces aquaticus TaxID=1231657 RepID=A0A1Y1YVJ5_9PLEO|nr:hypothetical protein BCR34DRAFT_574472 [Clohesyomyces aquaticus]